ncbi:MAG: hypothetical protein ACRDI1_10460, partial [Actinomycetota bacterium]
MTIVCIALALAGCTRGRPQEVTSSPSPSPAGSPTAARTQSPEPSLEEFEVPAAARPHDVAPAADGGIWYTAQGSGELGYLDPEAGETRHIPLGRGSAPHGVI